MYDEEIPQPHISDETTAPRRMKTRKYRYLTLE